MIFGWKTEECKSQNPSFPHPGLTQHDIVTAAISNQKLEDNHTVNMSSGLDLMNKNFNFGNNYKTALH